MLPLQVYERVVSLSRHNTGRDHDSLSTLSGGIQQWAMLYTGQYRIQAVGASGGAIHTITVLSTGKREE